MKLKEEYPISSIGRLRMGNDGPGIRTLIVLYGCPLRCRYCINPYTWDNSHKPKMMTAGELYASIVIDRPYILATNGGITFGGGEPLLYPGLINEMRVLCEPEMTFCVETSFNVDWENIVSVADAVDRFYVDVKSVDPDVYKEYTGRELAPVLENIRRYVELKGSDSIIVRVPEIPGMVDKVKQMQARNVLSNMGVTGFNLFRYSIPKTRPEKKEGIHSGT